MTTFIDMGQLGDQPVEIDYRYHPSHNGKGIEPDEDAMCYIRSVKYESIEIYDELSESFIDELSSLCKDDHNADMFAAIEEKSDRMRHPEIFD